MTQIAKHTFAIAFAVFITALTFNQVVTVPSSASPAPVILA